MIENAIHFLANKQRFEVCNRPKDKKVFNLTFVDVLDSSSLSCSVSFEVVGLKGIGVVGLDGVIELSSAESINNKGFVVIEKTETSGNDSSCSVFVFEDCRSGVESNVLRCS